ncbi:hypothetical protein ACVMFA_007490 [Bradyrhizobium liaoningense]
MVISRLTEEALLKKHNRASRQIEKLLEDCNDRLSFNRRDIGKRYAETNLYIAIEHSYTGRHSDNARHHLFVKESWPRLFGQRPAGFKWIPAGLC